MQNEEVDTHIDVLGYFGEVSFQSIHFAFSTIIYLELRRR